MTQRPNESFYNPNPYPNFNGQSFGYNNVQTGHTENQYGDHFTEFIDSIKHENYTAFSQLLSQNPAFATRVDITSRQPPMFHVALMQNQDMAIQMMRDLMAKGADPTTKDPLRQNPMSYVARDGKNKIFDFLSSVGVPSNEIDANQQTPLYYAAREGRYEIIRKILEQGANPNHLDLNSQTSLFYAAKLGHLDVCKLLVEYGAKHDQADFKKQTAFHYAKISKNQALIDYFQALKNGNKPPKEKPEPKVPPAKKKGPKAKEEPKTTFKLVFLNPSGTRFDVTEDEFERFRRTHPELADYLMHPDKIPPEEPNSLPKKDKWEKAAKKIISSLWKYKDSYIFHEPVDPVKLNCLDYFQIIKTPMDFGTIKNRLNTGYYKKFQEFLDDITLVFRNCYVYNGTGSPVGQIGLGVEGEFQKLCKSVNVEQILLEEQKGGGLTEHGDHESMQSFPQDLLDEDFAAHDMFNLSETGS